MSTAKKETIGGTLLVAFVLCIICSVIVAGSAVSLKPVQTANKQLDRKKNILSAAGMLPTGAAGAAEIDALFERFQVRMVDLDSGKYLDEQEIAARPELDPQRYDQIKAAKDTKLSEALPADEDIASIKRRENFAQVYLLEEDGQLKKIVLPIRGYGLWSTLYGFLVLEGDASTVVGLGYYDQKEPRASAARWTTRNGRRCGRASRSTTGTGRSISRWSRARSIPLLPTRCTRSMVSRAPR